MGTKVGVALTTAAVLVVAGCRDTATIVAATQPPTGRAAEFDAAAPVLLAAAGPAPMFERPCHPDDITATARTRAQPDGVVGVVDLQGRGCSLFVDPETLRLQNADGRTLDIPVVHDTTGPNPAGIQRPDLAMAAANVAMGFAWRGSWCSTRTIRVAVPLGTTEANAGHGLQSLHVPLTGPTPACHGQTAATVVPGLLDRQGQPVQNGSPQWRRLRISIALASNGTPATATLHNTGNRTVTMAPCPTYTVFTHTNEADGSMTESAWTEPLDCAGPTVTIPPHSSVRYQLSTPPSDLATPVLGPHTGVEFAIAGVPTATAISR